METQEEEDVFLQLTSTSQLEEKLESQIKTEEASVVSNASDTLLFVETIQLQNGDTIYQSGKKTEEQKPILNLCCACLSPSPSLKELPEALRGTYRSLCDTDDLVNIPEPALCVLCRRLLYNVYSFKEQCRAAQAIIKRFHNTKELEKSANLRKTLRLHVNLTVVRNIVECCNNLNIKEELNNDNDRPQVKKPGLKVKKHGLPANKHGPQVNKHGPQVNKHGPQVNKHGPQVNKQGSPADKHEAKVDNRIESETDKLDEVKEEIFLEVPIIDSSPSPPLIIDKYDADDNCDIRQINETIKTKTPKINKQPKKVKEKKSPIEKGKNHSPRKARRKKVAIPKERKAFGYDENNFDQYIVTISLTPAEQRSLIEKKRLSLIYEQAEFKCEMCVRSFVCKSSYDLHMEKHTEKIGKYICAVCHLHFRVKCRLRDHVKLHMHMFTCKMCPFESNNRLVARKHILSHQGKTYTCEVCSMTFKHKSSYLSHIRIKHPSSHLCQLCGYSFINEIGLHRHKNLMHRLEDKIIPEDGPLCDQCNTRFVDEAAFSKHFQVTACCNMLPNSDKSKRKVHEMRIGSKHIKRIRTVKCELCRKEFRTYRDYDDHFMNVHPNMTSTKKKNRRVLCDQCGKTFSCSTVLEEHKSVHSSEVKRPKCEECGRTFSCKVSLKIHLNVHSGIRYSCKICGKEFTNYSNRYRHFKYAHTEVESVKCKLCDKILKSENHRKTHMAHVHFNRPYPKRDRKKERTKQLERDGR